MSRRDPGFGPLGLGRTRQSVLASGPRADSRRARARRLFGIKCAQCQVGFSSSDLVMRARDSVYHIECFRCSVCSRQLLPGDEFSLREHELLCRADHGLLLERAAAGSPRSPGPLPGARGLHLPGKSLSPPGALRPGQWDVRLCSRPLSFRREAGVKGRVRWEPCCVSACAGEKLYVSMRASGVVFSVAWTRCRTQTRIGRVEDPES